MHQLNLRTGRRATRLGGLTAAVALVALGLPGPATAATPSPAPSTAPASVPAAAPSAPAGPGASTVPTPKGVPSLGFTVSWPPTTSPVQIVPGATEQGQFWVTNQTAAPITVDISPATAVPGNNGSLQIRREADKQFVKIVYSPSHFVAKSKTTTVVHVTVTAPKNLGPGVYLVPALVHPTPPSSGTGNIKIQQESVALATFQVPGPTHAHLTASFRTPPGTRVHDLPGLPPLQFAMSGREILHVRNDAATSLYSYYEIVATQKPFGTVVFDGHTVGDVHDLRGDSSLYFPHRFNEYPFSWHSSSLGIGSAHITAYVSFHPTVSELRQTHASIDVLVISPLWLLAWIVLFVLLTGLVVRRNRRLARAEPDARRPRVGSLARLWRLAGSVLLAAVTAAAALVAEPLVFAAVAVAALVAGAALSLIGRARSPRAGTVRTAIFHGLTGLALLAGVVLAVLSALTVRPSASPELAAAVVAGAGVWTLLGWWTQWWRERRRSSRHSAPRRAANGGPAPATS